jgi:hypothetical protein
MAAALAAPPSIAGTAVGLAHDLDWPPPLGCPEQLWKRSATPSAQGVCQPFRLAEANGWEVSPRGHEFGPTLLGPSGGGAGTRLGAVAGELPGEGWARAASPARCSTPNCILELVSGPSRKTGSVLPRTLSPLLLGCLAVLGTFGIRPKG